MTVNPASRDMAALRLYEAEISVEVVAERYALAPAAVIDFSLNVNPFGPPQGAIRAAAAALAASHLYPDLRVATLRSAVAAWHDVPRDALFFGAGLDDVLKLLLQAWTSPGDAVLVHLPTFPRYELEARLRGCRIVAVESPAPEHTDIAALDEHLRLGDIALAFICSPNNPTGERFAPPDIERLAKGAPDTIIVVDEALIDPRERGVLPLRERLRNLVILRTFSKYFGLAGLRIGYAVGDPDLIRVAEVGRPPFNVAVPSVAAAAAALDDREFLVRSRSVFDEERAWFSQSLAGLGTLEIRGSHANMLLVDLGSRMPGPSVDFLAQRGIVVADATSFRGLERHNVIRVSLRSRDDNVKLVAALGALP